MKIEHVAFNVPEPAAQADWYARHLGFTLKRSAETPIVGRFLADSSGAVMLELYRNPEASVPDYASMDARVVHVAFVCDDVTGTRERLLAAGAQPVGEVTRTPDGDTLAMLRDPWGLAIQFCQRAEPMV